MQDEAQEPLDLNTYQTNLKLALDNLLSSDLSLDQKRAGVLSINQRVAKEQRMTPDERQATLNGIRAYIEAVGGQGEPKNPALMGQPGGGTNGTSVQIPRPQIRRSQKG